MSFCSQNRKLRSYNNFGALQISFNYTEVSNVVSLYTPVFIVEYICSIPLRVETITRFIYIYMYTTLLLFILESISASVFGDFLLIIGVVIIIFTRFRYDFLRAAPQSWPRRRLGGNVVTGGEGTKNKN